MNERYKETKYNIYVYTSNIPHSGIPESNVYIQLYGKKDKNHYDKSRDAWLAKFPLEKSQNAKKFLPGQKDIFNIDDVNVGKIKKIRLTHDSLSEWHLKRVVIKNNETNKKMNFNCCKFVKSVIDLVATEFDSSDESESGNESDDNEKKSEDKYKSAVKLSQIRYDLKIKTSQFSKQATRIDIKLIGNRSESNKVKLNNVPSDKEKEKFLPDSLDILKLMERDNGVLEKILVFCGYDENENKPCDWFFDYIILDVPSQNLRYKFDSKSWTEVTEDSEKGNTILEIFPSEVKKTSKVKMIYKIELYTKKNKDKEFILGNLTVQLFGDFGKSPEAKPISKQFNSGDFEQDVFHFHSSNFDLGNIFKVKLVQKNRNKKLMWYLDRVKVLHDKQEWMFPNEKWIKLEKKEKKKELKLFEQEYRKSRKDFFNENKYSRTMSTLSHRLLNEDSINDDSYDESFEEEKPEPRSPEKSPRKRSISIDTPISARSDSDRSRSREISRERRNSGRNDVSPETRRRRSKSISIDSDIEDDLDKRFKSLKSSEPTKSFKERSFDYSVYDKIEDKFKARYQHLEPEDKNKPDSMSYPFTKKRISISSLEDKPEKKYDSKFETNNRPESSLLKYTREEKPTLSDMKRDNLKKLNEKIRTSDFSFDDSFMKPTKKRNELYNIDEEIESSRSLKKSNEIKEKSFLKNDFLDKPLSKKTTTKANKFDFDNDKEMNKFYKEFFNTTNSTTSSYDAPLSRKNQLDSFNQDKFGIPLKNKYY